MTAFFINVLLYSIMVHINCGMAGIARYSSWAAVIMIFAVSINFNNIITGQNLKEISKVLLIASTIITGIVIFNYGPMSASNTACVKMTPLAQKVLNYVPILYNPLHSTFNSRVKNIDGGYNYKTPIVYCNNEGHVKKILATKNDKEEILNNYTVF
jgi:hypothetical protein